MMIHSSDDDDRGFVCDGDTDDADEMMMLMKRELQRRWY